MEGDTTQSCDDVTFKIQARVANIALQEIMVVRWQLQVIVQRCTAEKVDTMCFRATMHFLSCST